MIRTLIAFLLPSVAFAQEAAPASPFSSSSMASFVPLLVIFFIFYFLLIRPQQKRLGEHKQVLAGLKKGDTVVTGGGKIGKVLKVADDVVHVELAPGVEVKVLKATISGLHGVAPAAPAAKASAKKKNPAVKNDNIVPSKEDVANDN